MDNLTNDHFRAEQIRIRLRLKLEYQREKINMEYKYREQNLQIENKKLVYPNQKEAVCEIIKHFSNGKHVVCLIAQPGVGKTGVALELGYKVATHPDDNIIVETENIHTHCGMNDVEWKEQYERNMLSSLTKNISHRSIIRKSERQLHDLTNGLIITDECHIASGKSMSQSKVLREAGLLNIDNLAHKNNKLCDISATPEGILEDIKKWGNKAAIVILKPGPIYKGFQDMMDEHRIRNAPELNTQTDVANFLNIFEMRYAGHPKRFFPMRGLTGDVLDNIRTVAIRMGWVVIHHDSVYTIENVDELMSTAPVKHTIISIKEYWRASKRLIRTHIGGTYEKPPKKRNTSATSQGLTARQCDNYTYEGEWLNPELRPLHYCDLTAIEEYVNWFNNGGDYAISPYTSANIKSKDGIVKSRQTLLHASNVDGLDEVEDIASNGTEGNNTTLGQIYGMTPEVIGDEPQNIGATPQVYSLSELFPIQSDAMEWGRNHINWDGEWNARQNQSNPTKVNPCNPDGSPGITHIRYRGGSHLILNEAEFRRQRDFGKFGSGVRCVPIKNGDTLSYIIVYKTSWLRLVVA